jgi:hypothetical protein
MEAPAVGRRTTDHRTRKVHRWSSAAPRGSGHAQ